jgi:hypothetical protein
MAVVCRSYGLEGCHPGRQRMCTATEFLIFKRAHCRFKRVLELFAIMLLRLKAY